MKYRRRIVAIAERYTGANDADRHSGGTERFERHEDRLGLHPLAEFNVHLPRLHPPVAADDELGRHRQEMTGVAVILLKLDTGFFVQAADLCPDPEDQAKRQRVTEIDIAQHRK